MSALDHFFRAEPDRFRAVTSADLKLAGRSLGVKVDAGACRSAVTFSVG